MYISNDFQSFESLGQPDRLLGHMSTTVDPKFNTNNNENYAIFDYAKREREKKDRKRKRKRKEDQTNRQNPSGGVGPAGTGKTPIPDPIGARHDKCNRRNKKRRSDFRK